jgi:hypothetical protein
MGRLRFLVLVSALTVLGIRMIPTTAEPAGANVPVTFNKDVLPILQQNCQECHRPGDIAPMSFMTYEGVRPWAKAIKTAVINRQMPPWFADPHVGDFRNAPKLTDEDIRKIATWADAGAPEGDAADKPAARTFKDGWRIQPDVVVAMPQPFQLAARGEGEIRTFLVPNPFREDTWVTSIEVKPGDTSVVHHVIVQSVDTQREQVMQSTLLSAGGAALLSSARNGLQQHGGDSIYSGAPALFSKLEELKTGLGAFTTMETIYAPGTSPIDFRYTDSAKLIKGGGQLRLEVHYTPNGKVTSDQTRVGFALAKGTPSKRFVFMAPEHLIDTRKAIPAGEANWETAGELKFNEDVELAWFMPHMHLRGKDMTYELIYPDGRTEKVLSAKFNFNWQLGYELEKPIKVPKGTRMIVTAHHDNSANNKFNPDARQAVGWGDLTAEEMMLPWFGVVVDRDIKPAEIASYRPRNLVLDDQLRALDRLLLAPPQAFEGGFIGGVIVN